MPAAADPVTLHVLAGDLYDFVRGWGTREHWQSLGYLLGWRWAVLLFLPALPLVWLVQFAAPRRWWLPFLTGLSLLYIAFLLVPWPQQGVLRGAVAVQGLQPDAPLAALPRTVLGVLHAALVLLLLLGVYRLAGAAAARGDRSATRPWRVLYVAVGIVCAAFAALFWLRVALINPHRPELAGAASVLLPDFHEAGLAFLLLKSVHYVWDCCRGQIRHRSWWRFISWMTFFPTYRTGPIERYHDFHTQVLRCHRRWRPADVLIGGGRIVFGVLTALLAMFIPLRLLPRLLARIAPDGSGVVELAVLELWLLAMLPLTMAYTMLYSYSEMAIGLCRLIGYRAAENFHWSPLSANLSELWSRTHISVTRCFRDYCYLPMMRRGPFRRVPAPPGASADRELGALLKPSTNYFVTFILCGLWHAPSLQAVAWGILMAVAMVAFDVWVWLKQRWRRAPGSGRGGMAAAVGSHAGQRASRPPAATMRRWAGRIVGILVTSHFAAFATLAVYNPHLCGGVLRELLIRPLRWFG